LIFVVAPTEETMGDVQRILYLHVAVAWCGLACGLAMGCSAAVYLLGRHLAWDHWSQAAAEVGWLCSTLTLVTGSAWAHEAWGTWWTWEPRLTSTLILWIIYAGIIVTRRSIEDPHRRARIGGMLAIAGTCDIPLVVMATRWFRGIHPVAATAPVRAPRAISANGSGRVVPGGRSTNVAGSIPGDGVKNGHIDCYLLSGLVRHWCVRCLAQGRRSTS
jgi:heme exporter protein C